ncbi:TRAM domain-containing protein [Halarchaeum salinum]|uniref:TRAM domain-containing protein n=1 Tax=Halarchaeum salinum TaxID=489912 RepID=A0AAV3S6Z8_9EURY
MSTDDTPVPVEEGEEYVVDVEDVGEEGDGIAHVEDFVVLVPDAKLGDQVRITIDTVQDEFAVADVLEHETDVE